MCQHAPYISKQELISVLGDDWESFMIAICSLLQRAQETFPKVFTTEMGLPCHKMLHLKRSCCIPGEGVVAPLGQITAKCQA